MLKTFSNGLLVTDNFLQMAGRWQSDNAIFFKTYIYILLSAEIYSRLHQNENCSSTMRHAGILDINHKQSSSTDTLKLHLVAGSEKINK